MEDNNSLSSVNLSNADSGDSGRGPSEEGEQSFNCKYLDKAKSV